MIRKFSISPHVYAFSAFLFFALMNSCVKSLHGQVQIPLVLCMRFGFGFLMFGLMTGSTGAILKKFRTRNLKYHLLRSLFAVAASGCIFYVMPHVPLAEISILGQTYPFLLLFLATYILREPVKSGQYLSCVLGFIGVLLIVRPSGDTSLTFSLLVLCATFLMATGDVIVRWLTRTDEEITIMLWFFLSSFILSLAWCILYVDKIDLTTVQWETILAASILGSAAQYLLTKAYKRLKAGTMAAYSYLTLCLSIIFGWMIFGEIPTLWMVAGGFFIIAGVQWNYLVSRRPVARAYTISMLSK